MTGTVTGTVSPAITKLINVVRGDTESVREMMAKLQLKGEDNFRQRYLLPAIAQGYITPMYPDSMHRHDQAYYLTQKGLDLLTNMK